MNIGAPGSIARFLDGGNRPPKAWRHYGAPFCVFAYVPPSVEPSGIVLRASCDTREQAERYVTDQDNECVVDVRTYGCAVPDHACASCHRLAFTGHDRCTTCEYVHR